MQDHFKQPLKLVTHGYMAGADGCSVTRTVRGAAAAQEAYERNVAAASERAQRQATEGEAEWARDVLSDPAQHSEGANSSALQAQLGCLLRYPFLVKCVNLSVSVSLSKLAGCRLVMCAVAEVVCARCVAAGGADVDLEGVPRSLRDEVIRCTSSNSQHS